MEKILNQTPPNRQTVLFSATVPKWVDDIIRKYTNNLKKIDLVGTNVKTNTDVTHHYYEVRHSNKVSILENILRTQLKDRAIIFTKTKVECNEVAAALSFGLFLLLYYFCYYYYSYYFFLMINFHFFYYYYTTYY